MKQQPTNDLKSLLSQTTQTESPETPLGVEVAEESKSKRTAKRQGKKVVMTFVDKSFHKQLRLVSIDKEINMEALVRDALELYLQMHQRKPI